MLSIIIIAFKILLQYHLSFVFLEKINKEFGCFQFLINIIFSNQLSQTKLYFKIYLLSIFEFVLNLF